MPLDGPERPAQWRWNIRGSRSRRASMAPRAAMARLGLCDNWNHSKTGAFGGKIGCNKSARRSRKKRMVGCGIVSQDRGWACSRFVLPAYLRTIRIAHWNHSKEGGGKKCGGPLHTQKYPSEKFFKKIIFSITQNLCISAPQFPCLCRSSRLFSVYEFQNIQSPVRQRQRPQGS